MHFLIKPTLKEKCPDAKVANRLLLKVTALATTNVPPVWLGQ
jgi:hypothetical protein